MLQPTTITLSVKMLGKRRARMEKQSLSLPSSFQEKPTLKNFLQIVVCQQVEKFNQKVSKQTLLPYLQPQDLEESATHGKVGFGGVFNQEQADVTTAVEVAWQAFEDGIFLVLVDGKKLENLTDQLLFRDASEVVFLRLVALTGGYF